MDLWEEEDWSGKNERKSIFLLLSALDRFIYCNQQLRPPCSALFTALPSSNKPRKRQLSPLWDPTLHVCPPIKTRWPTVCTSWHAQNTAGCVVDDFDRHRWPPSPGPQSLVFHPYPAFPLCCHTQNYFPSLNKDRSISANRLHLKCAESCAVRPVRQQREGHSSR